MLRIFKHIYLSLPLCKSCSEVVSSELKDGIPDNVINHLQKLQNIATHWLPIKFRIRLKI